MAAGHWVTSCISFVCIWLATWACSVTHGRLTCNPGPHSTTRVQQSFLCLLTGCWLGSCLDIFIDLVLILASSGLIQGPYFSQMFRDESPLCQNLSKIETFVFNTDFVVILGGVWEEEWGVSIMVRSIFISSCFQRLKRGWFLARFLTLWGWATGKNSVSLGRERELYCICDVMPHWVFLDLSNVALWIRCSFAYRLLWDWCVIPACKLAGH